MCACCVDSFAFPKFITWDSLIDNLVMYVYLYIYIYILTKTNTISGFVFFTEVTSSGMGDRFVAFSSEGAHVS